MIINLIIFLFSLNSLYGTHRQEDYRECDTIDVAHIVIANKINKTYQLGSATELQKAFGFVKAKRGVDEILGGYYYTYVYNGLEVDFSHKKWDGTTIKNRNYRILLKGHAYAVGDPISKLRTQFPISYKNRYADRRLILLFLTSGKIRLDSSVGIVYNAQGMITQIGVDNDNS